MVTNLPTLTKVLHTSYLTFYILQISYILELRIPHLDFCFMLLTFYVLYIFTFQIFHFLHFFMCHLHFTLFQMVINLPSFANLFHSSLEDVYNSLHVIVTKTLMIFHLWISQYMYLPILRTAGEGDKFPHFCGFFCIFFQLLHFVHCTYIRPGGSVVAWQRCQEKRQAPWRKTRPLELLRTGAFVHWS